MGVRGALEASFTLCSSRRPRRNSWPRSRGRREPSLPFLHRAHYPQDGVSSIRKGRRGEVALQRAGRIHQSPEPAWDLGRAPSEGRGLRWKCAGASRVARGLSVCPLGVPSRGTAAGRARPHIQMKAQTELRAGPGIGSSMSLPAWKRKNTFGWMALPLNYLGRWLLRQRQSSCESFPEGGKETASGTILTHLPRARLLLLTTGCVPYPGPS